MAMSKKCDGCGEITSYIFAAQYLNGEHEAIICKECYNDGHRCWLLLDGSLTVNIEQPEGGRRAAPYWDEGLFVTGGQEWPIYPVQVQPEQ